MKSIRTALCLPAIALFFLSAHAGVVVEKSWLQRYNGPGNGDDHVSAMALDSNGNVFVTGDSAADTNSPVFSGDFATIKYSNAGVPLWTNRYDGPLHGIDKASAMVLDRYGDVIVTGNSYDGGNTWGFATIKYSNSGVPLWTNRYSLLFDSAYPTAIAADSNNNVFVTGYAYDESINTIKYSSLGVPLWTNRYFGPPGSFDSPEAIAVDHSGNVFVAGYAGAGTDYDLLLFKYSNGGAPLWTNWYNGPGNGDDFAKDLVVDASDNVFVTGAATDANGFRAFNTTKYSNDGVPLWTSTYNPGGGGGATALHLVLDPGGNVIVTGVSNSNVFDPDWVTIKYSGTGVALWTNRFSGPDEDVPLALAVDNSSNVYVTGYRTSIATLYYDMQTIAYNGAGALLWGDTYNGPGNDDDAGTAILVDGNGSVLVAGYSLSTNGYADFVTIKYSVVHPYLNIRSQNNAVVLTWTNSGFHLQSSTSLNGPFTNIFLPVNSYTNPTTGPQRFFRLESN